jgi:hypothetical protein
MTFCWVGDLLVEIGLLTYCSPLIFVFQLGHVLGMNHDGAGNTCGSLDGKIMSLSTSKRRVGWSKCSIKTFINFLREGKGDCLKHVSSANKRR